MGKGINIITPNKKLSSGPYERYQQLKKLQRQSYMHYFYEVSAHIPLSVFGQRGVWLLRPQQATRMSSHLTVCPTYMTIDSRTQTTESLGEPAADLFPILFVRS